MKRRGLLLKLAALLGLAAAPARAHQCECETPKDRRQRRCVRKFVRELMKDEGA